MGFIESVTPKDTEEMKPGLFIQKTRKGYRQINPLAWNGKFRTKEQLKTVFSCRTIFGLILIIGLAWMYWHDVSGLVDFHNLVVENPVAFCAEIQKITSDVVCTPDLEAKGLCLTDEKIKLIDEVNLSELIVPNIFDG